MTFLPLVMVTFFIAGLVVGVVVGAYFFEIETQ